MCAFCLVLLVPSPAGKAPAGAGSEVGFGVPWDRRDPARRALAPADAWPMSPGRPALAGRMPAVPGEPGPAERDAHPRRGVYARPIRHPSRAVLAAAAAP